MNKALLTILLAVCVLGMALILLNERLSGDTPPIQTQENGQFPPLGTKPSAPQHTLPLTVPEAEPAKNETTPPQPQSSGRREVATAQETESVRNKPSAPAAEKAPEKAPEKKPENTMGSIRPIARTEQDIRASEKERETARPQKENVQPEKEVQPQQKDSQEKAGKDKSQKPKITKFVVFSRDKGATVRLVGSADLKYKTSQMHSPERVLIELDGDWDVTVPQIPKNPLVNAIRVGRQNNKTRIVLDMKAAPKTCRTIPNKNRQLDVRVDQ
ncbi:MAG: AMIN domain-containing protein [Desulfovibrio sp.]|nr:AMIN domain-containing protein [Desulfovibrio sp.]